MLLMIDSSRTPNALITVVMTSVTRATNAYIVVMPVGSFESRKSAGCPWMPSTTSGTVTATAVMVRTPAQK